MTARKRLTNDELYFASFAVDTPGSVWMVPAGPSSFSFRLPISLRHLSASVWNCWTGKNFSARVEISFVSKM